MSIFQKDPDAVLDYRWDWSEWLSDVDDTISTAEVTVSDGLTLDNSGHAAGVVTAWFSGGEPGVRYTATCRIVTTNARTDDRTITLAVRER